jgi:hypothetical protein
MLPEDETKNRDPVSLIVLAIEGLRRSHAFLNE